MSKDPAPGTGAHFDPNENKEVKSQAAYDAGITPPAGAVQHGVYIAQVADEVLENELEKLTLEEFVKKHTDAQDANVDAMARVLRMEPAEVLGIQRELGYGLPEGA